MFDLKRAWNCNMSLKTAVKRAEAEGISKSTVVKFWRDSAHKLGYWGSYPIAKTKGNGYKSRAAIIEQYSTYVGMFGTYAAWKGRSISYYLKKAGYEPLTEQEQLKYRCY